MNVRLRSIILILSSLFFYANGLLADEHYVAPNGNSPWSACNDANYPCSATTAMDNAMAGDIVYFRGGTYDPGNATSWDQNSLQPAHSGSDVNPITFKAYPGEVPFIVANQGFDGGAFGVCQQDWIIWDGFHSRAEQTSCGIRKVMYIRDAEHVIIRNCLIEGNSINTDGQNNSIISTRAVNYLTVDNCKFYNAYGPGYNSTAFLLYLTQFLTIKNCNIYGCYIGIHEKENNSNNTYHNNFIHDNVIGIGYHPVYTNWENFICKNNIFINNSSAHVEILGTGAESFDGLKIYNNTFYNNVGQGTGFALLDDGIVRNVEIFNNLVVNSNRFCRHFANEIAYADYNNFFGNGYFWLSGSVGDLAWWRNNTDWDDNSVESDPNFINQGGTSPADYKRSIYTNNGRGGSYASVMGAYITGDEIIGFTPEGADNSAPAIPKGLGIH